MTRCSISLIIRKMQIKTTMRYHFMTVRMAPIKKSMNNKCWRRYGEKATLVHCWWECKLVQPPWRIVWRFLKKLKIELLYDLATTALGIHSEKSHNLKRFMHPNVHCSTIHKSQDIETTYGQRSLIGCSPWGCQESDTTERLYFHSSLSCIGEGNGNPLQCSCLENPRDGGAWWAAVDGVAQSRTRLKTLSSSSRSNLKVHQQRNG